MIKVSQPWTYPMSRFRFLRKNCLKIKMSSNYTFQLESLSIVLTFQFIVRARPRLARRQHREDEEAEADGPAPPQQRRFHSRQTRHTRIRLSSGKRWAPRDGGRIESAASLQRSNAQSWDKSPTLVARRWSKFLSSGKELNTTSGLCEK